MSIPSRLPSAYHFLLVTFILASLAYANVEKTIFLGPDSITFPNVHPGLDDLCLNSISPTTPKVSTRLPVAFPTDDNPRGTQHWILLEGLEEGKRYEVRICWVATQPTAFWLSTHTITSVFEIPDLITALANYTDTRSHLPCPSRQPHTPAATTSKESVLFLRVHSAADFYSSNQSLMKCPPDVDVDIFLDPYIFNIFPHSLVPTGIYIIGLALLSLFVAGAIWNWLQTVVAPEKPHTD